MPLYDYGCSHCDVEKEVHHSVSEIGKIEVLCDTCGKPMKKLLSLPTLIGFDSVGRSRSKKDRDEAPKKETSGKDVPKKETSSKSDSKKNSTAA